MEPLSVVASVVSIADITFRLGRFLKRTFDGARDVDQDLVQILAQVEQLGAINTNIKQILVVPNFAAKLRGSFTDQNPLATEWIELWSNTEKITFDVRRLLERLETLLRAILGVDPRAESDLADEAGETKSLEQTVGDSILIIRLYKSVNAYLSFPENLTLSIPS